MAVATLRKITEKWGVSLEDLVQYRIKGNRGIIEVDLNASDKEIEIAAVNPGLFASAGTGEGPAAAGAVRIGPGGEQTPVTVTNFVDGEHRTVPIAVGDGQDPVVLLLFGSGMRGFSSVQAFVDGQEVAVFALVAHSVFVGLDQANIDLPESLAGTGVVEAYMVIDGVRTNSVLVEIE